MLVMRQEAREPWPLVEAGPHQLLERDDAKAGERGGKRMTVKDCDAGKRGGEQQKIDQHRYVMRAEDRDDVIGHAYVPGRSRLDSGAGNQAPVIIIFDWHKAKPRRDRRDLEFCAPQRPSDNTDWRGPDWF